MQAGYRTRRAIVVTDQGAYYGQGRTSPGRPDQRALLTDLPRLLAGAATAITGGEGVLMIGGGVRLADMKQPPAGSGWTYTSARPWTTYVSVAAGAVIHVGVLADVLEQGRTPLFQPGDDPDAIASMLDRFHALVGVPWRGTGGIVGTAALRAAHTRPGNGQQPRWIAPALPRGVRGVGPMIWHRELPPDADGRYVHVFDVNAMYLSALRIAPLAWSALEHTGEQPYDMEAAGFWQIRASDLPPALTGPDSGRPPVVPARLIHHGLAWVSGPVMRYLCQIGHNPEVIDSWTTTNTQPLARSVAERLSAVRTGMLGETCPELLGGVKSVYAELVGMLGREGGRIWRPDWQATIMDLARMNLQRRMDRAADLTGLWPIRVMTDSAYYLSDDPDPIRLGTALGLGTGPGTLRHTETLTVPEYLAKLDSTALALAGVVRK